MVVRIAVIGAGIVGLSSAVAVQNRLPEAQVEIIAEKFTRQTISDGSGGLFVPSAPGAPKDLEERWARSGASYYFDLAASPDSGESGVSFITGFELMLSDQLPSWANVVINFQDMPKEFKPHFLKFYKHGYMYTTVMIEGRKYLPWLTKRFVSNGGRLIQRRVHSFDELSDDYDLIINCAGVGASELTSDPEIQPMRGQLVRVSAPWIKHFVHTDDTHYLLPQSDTTAIGTTKQLGRSDQAIDHKESDTLLKEMKERVPALEGAKFLWDWVGIRPYRTPVRVEAEVVVCKGKQLKVIHNYGHGSYGMSLSWGTGSYAAELAQQALGLHGRQAKL